MRLGKYLDTKAGRLYLAVEGAYVVRLDGGSAAPGDVLLQSDSTVTDKGILEGDVYHTEQDVSSRELDTYRLLVRAARQVEEFFAGERRSFDLPIKVSGTPFQKKVWDALCGIPYGETRTYGEIARQVGSPKGARAVGGACNRNPVMILVPCHRVVGSTGKLVGFGGGLPMKEYLLEMERKSRCCPR